MNNKGFSFVELLVAIAILGIVSLPIASSFALSAKTDAKARETYSASNAAEDVLLLVSEIRTVIVDDNQKNALQEQYPDDAYPDCITAHYINLWLTNEQPSKEDADLENDKPAKYEYMFEYNGYDVQLMLTDCDGFYRVDATVTYAVAGDTMQVTRKGVLPHA